MKVFCFTDLLKAGGLPLDMTFAQWGRALYKYTDCGPWARATLRGGKEVYYEDIMAHEPLLPIESIEIGSIVEGSDVEIGPDTLEFPFDDDEFDKLVNWVNDAASFYWERDNSRWFYIQGLHCANLQYLCTFTWDEDEGDKLPDKDKALIEKLVKDGMWPPFGWLRESHTRNVGEYQVTEYMNDSCYE